MNTADSPIDPLRSLRGKPETRTAPRPEKEPGEGDFAPRYVDVPRRRRAQLAAERNLKWGLAVLLLSLGLLGAAIIVAGPRSLVPVVLCLVTFTILWAMARLRVFHQRNGVFFAAALVCLLGASVPLIERGYVELDRMAHAEPAAPAPAPAPAPLVAKVAAPEEPAPVLEKSPEVAPLSESERNLPSLVDTLKIEVPNDPSAKLVRVVEDTKVLVGRKPYLLQAGDTFVSEGATDGRMNLRARELRFSVPERAVEALAMPGPENEASLFPSKSIPPPAETHVSDREIPTNSVANSQAEAVRRYPAIGVKGSPENELFLVRFRQLQRERPEFFEDNGWPLFLAEGVAKEEGWVSEK